MWSEKHKRKSTISPGRTSEHTKRFRASARGKVMRSLIPVGGSGRRAMRKHHGPKGSIPLGYLNALPINLLNALKRLTAFSDEHTAQYVASKRGHS